MSGDTVVPFTGRSRDQAPPNAAVPTAVDPDKDPDQAPDHGAGQDRPDPSGSAFPPIPGAGDDRREGSDDEPGPTRDWAWVEQWRAGGEPTPWGHGIALAIFAALVVGVAVWVLSAGLIERPLLALLVNLVVAGGLAPAIWLSRDLPVLRWIAAGAACGLIGGWLSALMLLSLN